MQILREMEENGWLVVAIGVHKGRPVVDMCRNAITLDVHEEKALKTNKCKRYLEGIAHQGFLGSARKGGKL